MKRNFRMSIFIILTILLNGEIIYSQTISWELTSKRINEASSIAIASNGDLWVGTFRSGSGVFLSTDNGDIWVEKNNGLPEATGYSIAISPINGYIFALGSWKGVFRSTDRGESWVQVLEDMEYIDDIFITGSGEIYLGRLDNYYNPRVSYSSDNGNTWIEKSKGLPPKQNVYSLALGRDGTLYVGTNSKGVYRSTDRGDNWLSSSNYKNTTIFDLTISDDGSIFATTGDDGVLKSTDRGVTWTQVNTGLDVRRIGNIIYNPITKDIFVSADIMYDLDLYSKVYRSTNLGASWERINSGISDDAGIYAFAFNPNTGQIYVATDNGVYRSKNYPSFWERTSGPPKNHVSSLSVANNGDIWAITGENKTLNNVYLSTNNGNTWVTKNNGLPDHVNSIAINPVNDYLFINGSQGLFRSANRGDSWVMVTNDMNISSILITASGGIYLRSKGIYYSSDNGDTWTEKSNGLPDNTVKSLTLGRDGTLYAGIFLKGLYCSTDGGDTWLPSSNRTKGYDTEITISDDGSIFVSTVSEGVSKSTDDGDTWTEVNNGLNVKHTGAIIYNPITKDIFVSAGVKYANSYKNTNIYRSTDLGLSWRLTNSGFSTNKDILSFAFNPITGQMYVADEYGVYRSRTYPDQQRNTKENEK